MQLHIFRNADEMSAHTADWIVNLVRATLQKQDRFTLVLSGGSTPRKLHEILAGGDYPSRIDWQKVHVFWGDERFVPFGDERNNARMGFETLLRHVPVPPEQVHIIPTENVTPEASAEAYEAILKEYFGSKGGDDNKESAASSATTFDLVLLGMGDDGHTLSLFPGMTEVIHEQRKWCTSLWLPSQDMYRVTLTHPVVNRAAVIAFLVSGAGKAGALHEVINGRRQPEKYPAQIIQSLTGELHWLLDEAAAAGLNP